MNLTFSNGIAFNCNLEKDRVFPGIGGVLLKAPCYVTDQLPWTFYTESENKNGAWRFEEFLLKDIESDENSATLTLSSRGRWLPRIQEADAMGDARD